VLRATAIKEYITFIFTPIALIVFMYNSQVDYLLGFVLAIGNMGGAYVASKYAANMGTGFIRWFLLVVIFVFSLKLFGVFELLKNLYTNII
jgi:uncharacterized membrane protein YfcA